MTKDDLEMNNDNEIPTKKEEYDPSIDVGLGIMNFLGSFSTFFSGTLLFILYLYQNYNYEGSSFFSIRFWALLFIGEIILLFILVLLTGIFSYSIAFICETLIPLLFKKIGKVQKIRSSSSIALIFSSLFILLFITWKFSFSSFNYTYGNFTLWQIIKSTISDQEVFINSDGSSFIGYMMDGKPNGQGTLTFSDGRKYTGNWKDGEIHGQGKMTVPNGSEYEGEWKDSRRHGQGVFTFRFMGNEFKYVGEFRNDKGWNIITYDQNGKVVGKTVNGEKIEQ